MVVGDPELDVDATSPADAVARFLCRDGVFNLPDGPVQAAHLHLEAFDTEWGDAAWSWRLVEGAPEVYWVSHPVMLSFYPESALEEGRYGNPVRRGVVLEVDGGYLCCTDLHENEPDEILAEYAYSAYRD